MQLKLKHWLSKAALTRMVKAWLAILGALWLLLQLLIWLFPKRMAWEGYGVPVFLSLLVLTLSGAIVLARPKTSITRKLVGKDTKISVSIGDVLEQKGNIIIGFNDVFDTELGDLIAERSLQGQFENKFFRNSVPALDKLICESLADSPSETDRSKKHGKQDRYSIGTIATVKVEGSRYYLAAYSRMRPDERVESDLCKLATTLSQCWESIRRTGQREDVHMAIVGSDLSRTGFSRNMLLQFILLSFIEAETSESLTGHLTVYVYPSDIEHVDFAAIEVWMTGMT